MRTAWAALLATLAAGVPGCSESPQPAVDLDVEAFNEAFEPIQLSFRAATGGREHANWTVLVPPGRSTPGHLQGPAGEYEVEAAVVGARDAARVALGPDSHCAVLVANAKVALSCNDL